jgi:dihydrofolate reductase
MQGGTTFRFVTDGIESALEQARAAAGEKDVSIGGGANVRPAVPRADLLDEMLISVVSDRFIAGPDDAMGWVKATVCRRD